MFKTLDELLNAKMDMIGFIGFTPASSIVH